MRIESLAEHLTDQLGLAPGANLFVHYLPPEVSPAVMLRGREGGNRVNPELPGYRKTEFQAIVRDSDAARAKVQANDIFNAFTLPGEIELTDMVIKYCYPRTEPFGYPLSVAGLWEYAVTFDLCYVDTVTAL